MDSTSELIKNIINTNVKLSNAVVVVKLPSRIIEDEALLNNFVENVHALDGGGANIVIIHDYRRMIDTTLDLLCIDRKITNNLMMAADSRTGHIIEMVISGHINKRIVSKLCQIGCTSIGISGKDANLIQAKKISILRKNPAHEAIIDFGFIGEPVSINFEILFSLLNSKIIPVISPIALDINGASYLLDIDITAAAVACALDAKYLVLIDEEGVKVDKQTLQECSLSQLRKLYNENLLPRHLNSTINAVHLAMDSNITEIRLGDAALRDILLLSIFTNYASTRIIK